jgi:TetR/AcrR family transcriptional repressor of nem operon
MPRLDDARAAILDAAQELAQKRGYAGFSFRDIAEAVGVKSSSIHYHFPTKDDLISALLDRYGASFLDALEERYAANPTPITAIGAFIELCRIVLVEQNRMCLCGMMASEADLLPPPARRGTADFFEACTLWLIPHFKGLGEENPRAAAMDLIARLEGAMLMARISDNVENFTAIAERILTQIKAQDTA